MITLTYLFFALDHFGRVKQLERTTRLYSLEALARMVELLGPHEWKQTESLEANTERMKWQKQQ